MRRNSYPLFLLYALLSSALFEFIANTVGDGKLLQTPYWPLYFLVWWGSLHSILYFFLKTRPLWLAAVVWAIAGIVAEILVFKRSNLIVDPLIYAAMGVLPLWLIRYR